MRKRGDYEGFGECKNFAKRGNLRENVSRSSHALRFDGVNIAVFTR
jgi:hypothetical protein